MQLYQLKRVVSIAFATLCLVFPATSQARPEGANLAAMRRYYLDQLTHLPTYSPGKNSFLLQNLHKGDKRTVLDLHGGGSVRHIWSTWSIPGDKSDIPAPGRIQMSVFIDGHSQPTISATLDDLCRAAEKTGDRFVPLSAFNYKGAFNFYLPIFFARSIRIEIEATDEIAEFYTQIDYRVGGETHAPPLVSENRGADITLKYPDSTIDWRSADPPKETTVRRSHVVDYSTSQAGELAIDGPGIVRELSFQDDDLSDLQLEIYWDNEQIPSVEAPLKYFFADFTNAAMESKTGQSTTFFPMPFRKKARIAVRSLSGRSGHVRIEYSLQSAPLPARTLYFRAQFHQAPSTTGYSQYSLLQTPGEGLLVGMNLFDSGHNHGGGDAALIDAGTAYPRVLHGICGEDYFGFAWHKTGTMTPLTGAPAHERRYRLHLENPYPFHQSIRFLFGVFAGQHPKSVVFWYQLPAPAPKTEWNTFDIPWKIIGPVGMETSLPDSVSDVPYPTVISLNEPAKVEEHWQDVVMQSGFVDTTYQFRHYAMTEKGTGFVAGAGKTRMISYVYAPSPRKLEAILGHDDRVTFAVNSAPAADIAALPGFGPTRLSMGLRAGWNKLDLTIYNDENINWRWAGISLALRNSAGLKFASEVPASGR